MKRFLWLAFAALAIGGCKDLKDQQRNDVIGNSDTKLYYRNIARIEETIPKDKRVYFKSQDAAMAAGYTNAQEGGGGTKDDPPPESAAPPKDAPPPSDQ